MAGKGALVATAMVVVALVGLLVGAVAYVGLPLTSAASQSQGKLADDEQTNDPTEKPPATLEMPASESSPSASPSSPAPSASASASTAPSAGARPAGTGICAQNGPAQLAVEKYLATHTQFGTVQVDGKQDAADCAVIKKFQRRYGIIPAAGYAGPLTGRVVARLTSAHARMGQCNTGPGLSVCVDLTSQTTWVVRDEDVVFGPTTIRTGRAGLATPDGEFKISDKKRRTVSSIFHVVLPYWQRFNADMGFHSTPSYLYEGDSPGSHGCINLLSQDAKTLFGITKTGTPVHIFGRKPGT